MSENNSIKTKSNSDFDPKERVELSVRAWELNNSPYGKRIAYCYPNVFGEFLKEFKIIRDNPFCSPNTKDEIVYRYNDEKQSVENSFYNEFMAGRPGIHLRESYLERFPYFYGNIICIQLRTINPVLLNVVQLPPVSVIELVSSLTLVSFILKDSLLKDNGNHLTLNDLIYGFERVRSFRGLL